MCLYQFPSPSVYDTIKYNILQMILGLVQKFSQMLEQEDQMAVLCLLSHGANGFIYGYDGELVSSRQLTDRFNNVNCKPMDGKPKVVLVQSCQIGMA